MVNVSNPVSGQDYQITYYGHPSQTGDAKIAELLFQEGSGTLQVSKIEFSIEQETDFTIDWINRTNDMYWYGASNASINSGNWDITASGDEAKLQVQNGAYGDWYSDQGWSKFAVQFSGDAPSYVRMYSADDTLLGETTAPVSGEAIDLNPTLSISYMLIGDYTGSISAIELGKFSNNYDAPEMMPG
jgi:hypothetical protein